MRAYLQKPATAGSVGRSASLGSSLPIPLRSRNVGLKRIGLRTLPKASVIVQSEAPVIGVKPATSVTKPLWSSQSGQPDAGSLYRSPLVGKPDPLGATYDPTTGGVNFAIFSSSAGSVTLCIFTEQDLQAGRVTAQIQLDPVKNRSGDVWHIMLQGLPQGLLYGYKMTGPHQEKDKVPVPPPGTTAPAPPAAPPLPGSPPAEEPLPIDLVALAEAQNKAVAGHRHDPAKVLLDPYAKVIISRRRYGEMGPDLPYGQAPDLLGGARTWPQAAAAVPGPPATGVEFDWEGDRPLGLPMEALVIYEMHVRGFTQAPSSKTSAPGTYQGMVERLDYLKSLGVNAVELLPMQEFNELEYYSQIPGTNNYRYNFWGYSTIGFFAPMSRYSAASAAGKSPQDIANEFKLLVREAHKRGIEVILDVVFNHTAEGNEMGPTLSFRGLDNRVYYMLAPGGEYYNYSGCGNTLNCNHPAVRTFILDCLRHWVTEYHVDGFRFDLASILTRAPSVWQPAETSPEGVPSAVQSGDELQALQAGTEGVMTDGAGVPTGTPLSDPVLIEMISEDPVLRGTKMIAEAWDCDGLYQVGAFPHYGGRWAEWNGRFRDTVRNFIKGSDGPWAGSFASALCGSPDMYAPNNPPDTNWWANNGGRKWYGNRSPLASINFVTAHDGFTLADLVAYNEKHNEANGEGNRDGESHNSSWNCGEEGPANAWSVKRLRQRQIRNLLSALLLSHGVPMLHMGDEYGHSKAGNNNTYCHDSPLNWFDWDQARQDAAGYARFARHMVALRRATPSLQRTTFVTDQDIQWHGERPNEPDWSDTSRLVAFTLRDGLGGGIFVAFNTAHTPRLIQLPLWHGRQWLPVVDTGKTAPYDFLVADEELSEAEVVRARGAQAMWLSELTLPMLPWSHVILRSVPENDVHTLRSSPAKELAGWTGAY